MKILDSIRADIKKEAAEQERQLLLKVLQRRSGDLTLGELFQVLGSSLGQGIHAVRVAELFPAAAPAAAVANAPRTGVATQRESTTKTTKAKRTGRKRQAKRPQPSPANNTPRASKRGAAVGARPSPPEVSALTVKGRKQYDTAILNYLRAHPGLNRPADIRSVIGGSRIQFRIAMDRLRAANLAERIGQSGATTYAAKGSAAGSAEPQRTAKKSVKKRAQAARTPAKPAHVDDTVVLDVLNELGGWVSSSQILGRVGGSIDALRDSLKRLVTSGSVRRQGERKATRYAVASAPG
ncbi:hypothetical protein [Nannocystis sp. SCPEA4]|uniref:hypothetical protein n=1 Tax=Nannocystis sp. SCPEA4 TaxID=2996787 RepID=UPI00226F16E6|nr:hypothetical protein [Nannocystis sp. SCPEA4]MCY1061746.1 hypothetical protein [Nannocystis sp. SCPEA4]